ncbi:MAG: SDR family oxidoreductase [Treponemataceae bacterium]|nr:MAG: SDR family oxidoreductase [Treponemataceae bacterium]
MNILFIGGTGTISTAISKKLLNEGHELFLLNRGSRNAALSDGIAPENAKRLHEIKCDIGDENETEKVIAELTKNVHLDVAADFIAFTPEQVERDYRLFAGRVSQYIFISSASAYQKLPANYLITESTPLANPYWEYSRNKIACEDALMRHYRDDAFPVTIVRPSHTYDERSVPLGVHGKNGSWQVVKRIMDGKPVIVHGDGTSLWTITHNSDFALGFTGLVGNIHAIGEAVQIMSAESLTWNQIYETIAHSLKRLGRLSSPLRIVHVASDFLARCAPHDTIGDFTGGLIGDKSNSVVFDTDKLKRLVPQFNPTVRADQGIFSTIEYVLSHKDCQKEDADFDTWCDRVIAALDAAASSTQRN